MKRTVFYSWQSDLPSAGNRNVIEESLKRAIRAIGRDDTVGLEPVLDRDTANLAGAPDIAHSILAKIAVADVFVADVSIINIGAARPSPNPNVLVELGYAVAELGWSNVVLVQNTAFGGPELLPLDLRGRRTVTYEMRVTDNRSEARALLQGRLETALRASLEAGLDANLPAGPDAPLWWGHWIVYQSAATGGTLFIREVGPGGFLFDLSVVNGTHTGEITAYARILSTNVAYCRLSNGSDWPDGELIFRRSNGLDARRVQIEEASRCFYYGGGRAHFGGTYVRIAEPWFDRGFLNELELARLHGLVGHHMHSLRNCTADIGTRDGLENSPTRVVWGGVAGMYTIAESIVMCDERGQMWVAFIDDDSVRYFTNVPGDRDHLPRTLEDWRTSFQNKLVIYSEPVHVVPVRVV